MKAKKGKNKSLLEFCLLLFKVSALFVIPHELLSRSQVCAMGSTPPPPPAPKFKKIK